jgi:hypothetical protein
MQVNEPSHSWDCWALPQQVLVMPLKSFLGSDYDKVLHDQQRHMAFEVSHLRNPTGFHFDIEILPFR